MDLRRSFGVLWRFRFLVVAGVLLALALAFLAYVRVEVRNGTVELEYRSSETWESSAILLITQEGFPWGRSVTEEGEPLDPNAVAPAPRFGDSERFESLSALYSALAMGDPVQLLMERAGPIEGEISAQPVLATDLLDSRSQTQLRSFDLLPLVRLSAEAEEPDAARALVARHVAAFRSYLEAEQDRNGIAPQKRVLVNVLEGPREPELVDGRSKAYALLIALVTIAAFVLAAFALESLFPRRPLAAAEPIDGRRELPRAPARTAERARR